MKEFFFNGCFSNLLSELVVTQECSGHMGCVCVHKPRPWIDPLCTMAGCYTIASCRPAWWPWAPRRPWSSALLTKSSLLRRAIPTPQRRRGNVTLIMPPWPAHPTQTNRIQQAASIQPPRLDQAWRLHQCRSRSSQPCRALSLHPLKSTSNK